MKKSTTLLFLLYFFSTVLWAQTIPNYSFKGNIITIPCPYDELRTVSHPISWTIYQTFNDAWDGTIDSSQCIQIYQENDDVVLRLNEIDLERPVFLRNIFHGNPDQLLQSDYLYTASMGLASELGNYLALGDSCANGLCSGVLIGIEIPDSTGQGNALRTYPINATEFSSSPWNNHFEQCMPTEYFSENRLKEVIFKFSFLPGLQTNATMPLGSIWMEEVYAFSITDEVIAPESTFNGNSYDLNISQAMHSGHGYGFNYLLRYQDSTYPSNTYPSYVEAAPAENPDIPAIINLSIEEEQSLIPQPFTMLQGALVTGDSMQRHELNVINNGGDLCIIIVELVFDGSTHFIYQGGKVELTGRSACMQFINGARLEVAKDAHLDYGRKGEGALAIGKNSTIRLKENSRIHINNDLVLLEKSNHKDEQVYIELKPGNVLSFGEKARLWKHTIFPDGQMQLNVLMNGGVLDDQHLSEYERKLIRRIYPQPKLALKDNLLIQQNPVDEHLAFQVLAQPGNALALALYNQEGKLLWRKNYTATEGYDAFEVQMANKASGLYFLQVKNGEEQYTEKIVKR